MKTLAILLCASIAAAAAARKPLSEYPIHASTPDFDIGVEYTVHSYADASEKAGGQMYLAREFLVFDVAIFPKHPIQLANGAFELTVDKKRPIPQIQPEFVAAAVRQPEWTTRPQFEGAAGVGDVGVGVGGTSRVERFPGDPTARNRLPAPPRAPEDEHKAQPAPVDAGQIAIDSALIAQTIATPQSGNIYFPYSSNAARIKRLVLHVSIANQTIDIVVR